MSSQHATGRESKLVKLFHAITTGEKKIGFLSDSKNFLNACAVMCRMKSPSYFVEMIISRPNALGILCSAVRSDLNPVFMEEHTLPLIGQLANPDVQNLNGGDFLDRIVYGIVYPSSFWDAIMIAHQTDRLTTENIRVFGWLCFQVANSRNHEKELVKHYEDVAIVVASNVLANSPVPEVQLLHRRIEKILETRKTDGLRIFDARLGLPGGRHDNDFSDYREIALMPTHDELRSEDFPFLQRLEDVFASASDLSAQTYLDWLFRALREDMLAELREDFQGAFRPSKRRRRPFILGSLTYAGYDVGIDNRSSPCAVDIGCGLGLEMLANASKEKAKNILCNDKNFLKHQALVVLCSDNNIVAFGTLRRNETKLLYQPPVVTVRFDEPTAMEKAVQSLALSGPTSLSLVVINTATFAYIPILQQLQRIRELPLEAHLLTPGNATNELDLPERLVALTSEWKETLKQGDTVLLLNTSLRKPIEVRGAQLEALLIGLTHPVAQIQGPPGTGKSFMGALIAKLILDGTHNKILVMSYTNHAVDQFIEDLFEMGIDEDLAVRLGSKSSLATARTRLDNVVKKLIFRMGKSRWDLVNHLKKDLERVKDELAVVGSSLRRQRPAIEQILEYLEFSDNYTHCWAAFQVPSHHDGFVTVAAGQKAMTSEDLYLHWLEDRIAPTYQNLVAQMPPNCRSVWRAPFDQRQQLHAAWVEAVRNEQCRSFSDLAVEHDNLQRQIDNIFDEPRRRVLREARVIACTTTAAAMYKSILESADASTVIIEEAGEILEAHVVTAMTPSTKQLILIGDHKQLPPKVNNYALTKEKGDGYDLNVSLFERLIRHGNAYATLRQQHRSHPDISQFARLLAYENLEDVMLTQSRDPIRGLQSRVAFVHHEYAEVDLAAVKEKRDVNSKATKQNLFEARMVLKMVKYLGQQGYKTENMVILTPYLGQLSLLRETLRKENDPYLNDLDSNDLVQAGLMTEAAAKVNRKRLRLSTIDNYQGEESDIVIVSMTRSNPRGEIGFLSARERLVVLMSRARNGIILFGNMNTFIRSTKGGELWQKYFEALKEKGFLFDGVPTHCEQHPDRHVVLKTPEDFDQHCPDGGCALQCHRCKRRCHRNQDHSQEEVGCKNCAKEDEDNKRRILRNIELESKRQEAQDKYRQQIQEADDEIDRLMRLKEFEEESKNQAKELEARQEKVKLMQQAKLQAEEVKQNQLNKPVTKSLSPIITNEPSNAKDEWESLKRDEGTKNDALDEIMGMIGLESVKQQFLSVKTNVDTKIRQGISLNNERLSCSLLGNPGTGKTTVARIWAKFLVTVGALSGQTFKETTGSKMASDGVKGCEALLESLQNDGGGVLFIDEAYQLSSGNSPGGKAVLDFLLAEVENLRGTVSFVLAGYSKQMESFFAHNPGFPSRFPIEMKFEDYDDRQLLDIFRLQLHRQYQGRMEVDGGADGLYARIATRRIGYSRGKEGFGNARAVENMLATIMKRQADRLRRERRLKLKPDDLFLSKEDLIGPEPSEVLPKSKGWQKLHGLTGLGEVKETAKVLFDTLKANYDRELAEKPLIELSLNRVFVGNPGTGKTTVAKYYGQILVDLGLLSNGEVVVKNPSDFVGAHLGQSEAQTKAILAATVGKVLVIDEAYGLYSGSNSSGGGLDSNPYNTAVIDTIVAEVQSVPGDDRCVLLLGYQDKMEAMFQNVNPGLSRRFPMSAAFVFEDFDDEALMDIFDRKVTNSGFEVSVEGRKVALEVLQRRRNRPNFGNAGEVDILLDQAKISLQKKASLHKALRSHIFEAVDFDKDFDRGRSSKTNIRMLFDGDVGRESLIELLEGFQKRVQECKQLDMDPEIPFNFLFRGPPGTGKTTTARKIGKVYYDMGFLSTAQVHDCSATELIGEYVGQTGPKVQRLVESALGRVLLIDEAYRLCDSPFAKEALDELVDLTTKPKFQNKIVIILAGYVQDINLLISKNPGMTSRFPTVVDFAPLDPSACVQLITTLLRKKKQHLESKGRKFDMTCISAPEPEFRSMLERKLGNMSRQEGWASARDVETLTKSIFHRISLKNEIIIVSVGDVLKAMDEMYLEREERTLNKLRGAMTELTALQQHPGIPPSKITQSNSTATTFEEEHKDIALVEARPASSSRLGTRDAGVSDEVWEQLQKDALEEDRKQKAFRELKRKEREASRADRERLVRLILEEEEKRRKEEAQRQKLLQGGLCPAGFNWIKQQGGYRCGGGSHWMSDSDIELL
ncbi:NFX1-type zinc finger-containing protein 1 [Paramyrothecium foliicola]|nr:NFX1-type zinc finger-containing protein 1 [Paramyrothecium foliicola]